MDAQFNSSDKLPEKGEYKDDSRAHVTGDYKLLSCNCTTTVSDALNTAGSHALETIGGKAGPTNDRFIIPGSLGSHLKWQANSWLGNGSVSIEAVFKPKENK